MSFIVIPTGSEEKLPSIRSAEFEDNLAPIHHTVWKCRRQFIASLVSKFYGMPGSYIVTMKFPQINLGVFSTGCVFGWGTVAIEDLARENRIKFNEAIMASLFIIGAVVAGPITGYLMGRFGRKMSLWGAAMLLSLGWILISLAHFVSNIDAAVTLMYIGRIVTGVAGAAALLIAPVYIREICSDEFRGEMGGLVPFMLTLGNYFSFTIGVLLSWFWLSVACLIFPAAMCILLVWIPESPRYLLLEKGDHHQHVEEAMESFFWYTAGFEQEERDRLFRWLKKAVEFLSNAKLPMRRSVRRRMNSSKEIKLTSPEVMRPLIVSVLLVAFQQGSGTSFLTGYTVEIFKASGGSINPELGTNLVGLFLVIFVVIAIFVVDKMGRKPLLLISACCMSLTLYALGTFFYLKSQGSSTTTYLTWIPAFSGITFVAMYSLGLGTVTWTLSAEINHPDFREISGTLTATTYWLTAFLVTLTFPYLRDSIGYHWCCWMYASVSLIACVFIIFFIFETKGKTTREILAHYKGHMYMPGEDDDGGGDTQSLGSIVQPVTRVKAATRPSTDSGGSWGEDMEVLFEEVGNDNAPTSNS